MESLRFSWVNFWLALRRLGGWTMRILGLCFKPDASRLSTWVGRAGLLGLFLLGLVVWGSFFNWGDFQFDRHDWTQEGPRYAFLRQALLEGQLPLHIQSELAASERYFAIPDVTFSPQIVLLLWLEPARYVLVNSLLLYSLGFVGLWLLKRRYGWSLFTFALVFILFMLNGSLSAHLAVGHSMWVSAFLLPYFVLLVLRLLDGAGGWRWVLWMALLQVALFAQGGFHFVIWCLMFLLLLALFQRRQARWLLAGIGFSLLLNLARILPPALEYASQDRRFISGFFSVTDMVSGFITLLYPPQALEGMRASLPWWEVDYYTGLVGFAFILIFGVWLRWKHRANPTARAYAVLLAPIGLMALLSLGKLYEPINRLPIPLVDAERVSSRFLLVPLTFLIVLAGNQFESWLKTRAWSAWQQAAALLCGLVVAHDLLQHLRLWRVENMALVFKSTPVDIHAGVINHADPSYLSALMIGLALTGVALVFLAVLAARQKP